MTKLAVVFPGQGSQRVGMAKDFCNSFQVCRDIFDRASELLKLDMRELCFTENPRLNQVEFTQVAILTAEIGMFESLKKHFGLVPEYYAGHSLGEYTALVAAGVINFEDAIAIVHGRDALMQQAKQMRVGGMAALIHDDIESTDYMAIVKAAGAEVANFNSTAQTVISGALDSITNSCAALKERYPDMRTILLEVSAPFHSSHMSIIEEKFKEYLHTFQDKFNLTRASSTISNFTGTFHDGATLVDTLVKHLSGSVQWIKNMRTLSEVASPIIEIGPTPVLRRFFSSIGVEVKSIIDLRSCKRVLGSCEIQ